MAPALMVLFAALNGTPSQDLKAGIALHQEGEFAQARDALQPLTSDPALTDVERVKASEYLASACLNLNDRAQAKGVLRALLELYPDVVIDPGRFVPDLIVLEQEVRLELGAEQRSRAPTLRATPAAGATGRTWAWACAAAAVAAGITGGAFEAAAGNRYDKLSGPAPSPALLPRTYASQGATYQTVAQATGAAAVALAVASGTLFLTSRSPSVTLAPMPGGASLWARVSFP